MDAGGKILGKRACQDHPPASLKKHHLVSQNVLSKKAALQMAASMGHFKLVGSPKQKSYRPRRRLQYQKETAESPSKSHRSFPITA